MPTPTRNARTEPLRDEDESLPGPRLSDLLGVSCDDEQARTAADDSDGATVLAKFKEAGLPFIDSKDPVGQCTLSNGDQLTFRELDGLDETFCEQFLDHYDLKAEGAGRSASLRFMALMSISHVAGKEQAPIRHVQQLERLLRYKRADLARVVACYIRFNLGNRDSAMFRQASA